MVKISLQNHYGPITFGAAHTYIAHVREYPPGYSPVYTCMTDTSPFFHLFFSCLYFLFVEVYCPGWHMIINQVIRYLKNNNCIILEGLTLLTCCETNNLPTGVRVRTSISKILLIPLFDSLVYFLKPRRKT